MTYGVIIDGETFVAEVAEPTMGCSYCDLPVGCCSVHDFGPEPISCFPAFASSNGQRSYHMKRVIFTPPTKKEPKP